MRSRSAQDRFSQAAVGFVTLPFFALGFFWMMLAVVSLLGQADDPSTALWGIALVAAVGFAAVAVLTRLALLAGSLLLLAGLGLRRAGRIVGRMSHTGMRGA